MKITNLIIISCLFILGAIYFFSNSSTKLVNYPPRNSTVVAFGDSLVFGTGSTNGNDFVSLLGRKLEKKIVNLGVPGNTTSDGLARISEIYSYNTGTVILLLGGNDYLRKIPKEETFRNLKQIITTLQSRGIFVVLLGVRGGVVRDNFETLFEDLAQEMGVAYVSDVLNGLVTDSRYMSDPVHPNDEGYKKIAEKIYDVVGKNLK